jgi:hypothetical protein
LIASQFFNRLESWWNRPSRLEQAADEIIKEDRWHLTGPEGSPVLVHKEDVQNWLEVQATRTSILHQLIERLEQRRTERDFQCDQSTSRHKAVLCAQLVKEYLTTVVNLFMSISAAWKVDLDFSPSPSSDGSETSYREVLSISVQQIFHQLRNVQTELAQHQDPAQASDARSDLRQTRTLIDEAESNLFILFDAFSRAGLAELDADDSSDSSAAESSDGEDDGSLKAYNTRGKIRSSPRTSTTSVQHKPHTLGQGITRAHPRHVLLFDMVNHVNRAMTQSTTDGIDTRLERGWFMLDIMEGMRKGLAGLYLTTSAPRTLRDFDRQLGIPTIFSKERTTNIECRESIAWTTFNASLIKVSLSLAIYGHQQRMNSPGKANRRQRTVKKANSLLRSVLDPMDSTLVELRRQIPQSRTLSMPDVEKAWIDLLEIASVSTDLSSTRSRVVDMLRLIISLWDRQVEYETAIWMTLPGARPRVTDYIDDIEVAKSFRFLIGEAMWRHGLTAGRCLGNGEC